MTGRLDPASLQILISRLTGVADEMGAVLRRAASSPNIKERADCSAALFTAAGELLVQAEHIPVHLGSMPASVRAAIDGVGVDALKPGDQVIVNDPFAGGTHLNDITLVAPAFVGDSLIGWAANRAHHADVGGMVPGSIAPDADEVYQEGLRIPPVVLSPAIVDVLLANSRTPDERRGDLDAQLGANAVGVSRLCSLFVGGDRAFDEVLDYGERRMRAAVGALPDGTYSFADVLDSPRADVVVRVDVAGDSITFDFTGSSPQRRGNVNAVEAVTVSSVSFALRSVVDPTMPANGGAMRCVSVVAEPGSVVCAVPPAAVGAGNVEVSQRVADVCLGALAQAVPSRVGAASQGTMNNVLIGGRSGGGWVYYETIGGGQGGRPGSSGRAGMSGVHTAMTDVADEKHPSGEPRSGQSGIPTNTTNTVEETRQLAGQPRPGQSGIHTNMTNTTQLDYQSHGQSGIHTGMTNTLNTPIEALERGFPMRVVRYTLRRGSGGAGLAAGGEGIERDMQVLEDCTVSLITERRLSRPWGLDGGEPGAVGENWLLRGGDETRAERLPDKCTVELKAGDVVRMLTPGGGGFGPSRALIRLPTRDL